MINSRATTLLVQFAVAMTLLSITCRAAKADPITAEVLVTNCQELIAIYDRKGEQRFIAGMSTSVAEAMRAGICRGMIEEHTNHGRCIGDWRTMASIIAEQNYNSDVEDMLEYACGN